MRNAPSRRRGRPHWLPVLLLIGTLLNGVRLRQRLGRLATLEPTQEPVACSHRFLTAAGVDLDEQTRREASAYARHHGLAVLDLVPADLPVDQALDLAGRVDPATYHTDRLAPGRGAYHALLVDVDLLQRAGITTLDELDPVEFAQVIARLKRYAPASTNLAVAPGLRAVPEALDKRRALLKAIYPGWSELVLAIPGLRYVAFGVALRAAPAWGAAAVAAFCLKPLLIVAGRSPIASRDATALGALLRLPRDASRWARTLAGRWQSPAEPDDPHERLRPAYAAELAAGTDRFFETRRSDCPWCGSTDLGVHLVGRDLIQGKPGRFILDRCGQCGHIFQNPRLSLDGLDFYYRDCYDGLGAESTQRIFALNQRGYQARATMLKPFTTPKAWLDVGAGHGHFCTVARDVWPETVFDGLDMSQSIEEAQRCRWVDHGHRGLFPELAGELAGRYDVVSMHHYLEHTREPFAELDAAATVLPHGGYLLIEQPDPESPFGRLLGRRWMPWFQPQHQHMIRCDNLVRALADRGFTTVSVERGKANQACDLVLTLALALHYPIDPRLPWLPRRPTALRRGAHTAKRIACLPLLFLAHSVDLLLHQVTRHTQRGDTYRILARKDGH